MRKRSDGVLLRRIRYTAFRGFSKKTCINPEKIYATHALISLFGYKRVEKNEGK